MKTPDTEGWEKTFDSMFNWADQIKEQELERWILMYGFVPNDLKTFIRLLLASEQTKIREEVIEEVESIITNWHTDYEEGREPTATLFNEIARLRAKLTPDKTNEEV